MPDHLCGTPLPVRGIPWPKISHWDSCTLTAGNGLTAVTAVALSYEKFAASRPPSRHIIVITGSIIGNSGDPVRHAINLTQ